MKKNKILITGATGFIGYHLAKRCLKLKWTVHSVSINLPPNKRRLNNVKYIRLDISKEKNLKKKLSMNYDYIVNLAGYVDHSNKAKTMKSHFNGCKNLAKFFLNRKIKKFIQIGSGLEYGKLKSPQIESKNNFQKTYSTYAAAKLLSTRYLLDLKKKKNFPVTILRLYQVYGPKQDVNRIIPITITNALSNKKFDCSSGNQFKDFLYIDDLIDILIKILKKRNTASIINVGSGKPIKVKKLILNICELVGGGYPKFGVIPLRKDEINKLYPNLSILRKTSNWRPKIRLNDGLKKTIRYFAQEI